MFTCVKDNQQQGFILVMALIYLFVIALMVTSAFSSSLLQTKMSIYAHNHVTAFQNAESALATGEIAIQGIELKGEGRVSSDAWYSFTRTPQTACGLVFYQVNATGIHVKAKVNLQSLFAVPALPPVNPDECPGKALLRHRVFWLVM